MESLTLFMGILGGFGWLISLGYLLGLERIEKIKKYTTQIFAGAFSLIIGYIIITK